MKSKKVLWSILTVIMLLSMTVGAALAEDMLISFGAIYPKRQIMRQRKQPSI